ncbi:MAG: AMP-binding protein [Paludibacteraceae bacterium]|nr:AMP-binding protein [Paludibacteraceae bacterium]
MGTFDENCRQTFFTYHNKEGVLGNESDTAGTPLHAFMQEWKNDEDYMMGNTSGSTGTPKPIRLSKKAMIASAKLTNQYFKLQPGNTILLCLSTDYIAGKMVVVRAMVGGLRLVVCDVSRNPEWEGEIDFAAMVPMQVENVLKNCEEHNSHISSIHSLIIGGSPLSETLYNKLADIEKVRSYITYGMTETLSHVAVAPIKKGENTPKYEALPGIKFSKDDRECLIITAPHLLEKPLATNDVVELEDNTHFIWKGRWDNVVNSGGVKLHPEQIEKKLAPHISHRFYLIGEPDDTLGSKLVLYIESEDDEKQELERLKKATEGKLGKYEFPKEIIMVKKFQETDSGKIKRASIQK